MAWSGKTETFANDPSFNMDSLSYPSDFTEINETFDAFRQCGVCGGRERAEFRFPDGAVIARFVRVMPIPWGTDSDYVGMRVAALGGSLHVPSDPSDVGVLRCSRTSLRITRPFSDDGSHHLHILDLEVLDEKDRKLRVLYNPEDSESASLAIGRGDFKSGQGQRTPQLAIDGDMTTWSHNDYGSGGELLSDEDHFMEFELLGSAVRDPEPY